ncbi:hypothetical protein [Streptomyces resistomycificus]|uniref:LigA protein n=1 Tax=Streptomyces resistomycificus TaxID=67356 RepID=A0A0L8LUY2_9ACTN|nr:hypothetical protein [Streptomyces resistomycificus]KOG41956.1 hypothetical protein ADK37_06205 [Streptomyces resistomycificus]KUN92107.1 hypothetical protein AQJ84_34345 [Streptomyces resistomycificus]
MPVDQHSDPFEDRLGAALRQTGDTFAPDGAALAAAGRARGRRLRLRRRAAVVSGAASLALVGAGAALVLPGDDSAEAGRSSVASGPTVGSSPTPTAQALSRTEMISTLRTLLPEGQISGGDARGTNEDLPPYAQVVFDDGKGAGSISLGLDRIEPGSDRAREVAECPDKTLTSYDSCTSTRLPDGSLIKIFRGYEYPDRREDTKLWTADLITPAGQYVTVSEWNAAAEKGAPVSRPNPPLSEAQLEKLVSAEVWRQAVDAMPEDAAKTESSAPVTGPVAVDGDTIGQTLAGLLPKGVEVVSKGGQDTEYAYLVVDDGKGRSLVQINVQPDMRDVAHQLFGAGSEIRPDGTLVAVRQGLGEKSGAGVVMLTADTMRTNGMRVVVSAFNTGDQNSDATRATPALTVGQLKEIALSPKWERIA